MENYIGQIMAVAFARAPKGWALCNGQMLNIRQNSALFSLIGTYFGGDGVQTFGLPDLRGRTIRGMSGQPGMAGGLESVTLLMAQMPQHNHSFTATTAQAVVGRGGGLPAANNSFAVPANGATIYGTPTAPVPLTGNITPAGGSGAHPNMQPYATLNFIIALTGIYPSRP